MKRPLTTDITRTHYAALDGLRGLAILAVMLYHFCLPHARFHSRDSGFLLQVAQGGWLGVDLFFVLSGFLITGILAETRSQPHYFRNFLGRRFLRIWPLYYISLFLLIAVFPWLLPSVPPQLEAMQDKQSWFWLYAANWLFASEGGFTRTSGGYFWSLAVEEQFYLVWPLVVYAASDRQLLRISGLMLLASLVARVVLANLGVGTNVLYAMTFTHLDGLAVGSALAVCARSPSAMQRVQRSLPFVAAIGVLGLVFVRVVDGDALFWSRRMATFGYTFAALLFGVLLVWVLAARRTFGMTAFFASGVMRRFGKYSYALYLIHVPVAGVAFPTVRRALAPWSGVFGYDVIFMVAFIVSFAVSWGLATLSWHLVEKRILSLKRFFSYEPAAQPAAESPAAVHSVANMPRG